MLLILEPGFLPRAQSGFTNSIVSQLKGTQQNMKPKTRKSGIEDTVNTFRAERVADEGKQRLWALHTGLVLSEKATRTHYVF